MNPRRTPLLVHRTIGVALVAAAAVFTGGCYHARTAYVGGVEVAYDNDGYYDYATYPHYWWDGRVVYLVGDRWYYRAPEGWVYFVSEPSDLYAYRRHYYGTYGYSAPPAYGRPPPTRYYSAPPAHRAPYRGPQVAPPAPRARPYPYRR